MSITIITTTISTICISVTSPLLSALHHNSMDLEQGSEYTMGRYNVAVLQL